MEEKVRLMLGLYAILLFSLTLILILYSIYYFNKQRKQDKTTIDRIVESVKKKLDERPASVANDVVPNDSVASFNVSNEKATFNDQFENLSNEQKNYYKELLDYSLSLDNTNLVEKEYERSIKIGKGKILSTIKIKNDLLVVKLNMGKLKVGNGVKPLTLKPIKITIKDNDSLEKIKTETNVCYLKQTGVINVNYEEGK